jgi:hypothetical protein
MKKLLSLIIGTFLFAQELFFILPSNSNNSVNIEKNISSNIEKNSSLARNPLVDFRN